MEKLKELEKKLKEKANPSKAKDLQRFFKTGKGEYGEGDIFLGIIVPEQRKIANEFKDLRFNEIQQLLDSEIHEKRMIGLFILIEKFKKADNKIRKDIFEFYLDCAKRNRINNWDLVDLSAPRIVGGYLLDKLEDRKILYGLTKGNLWEKRISLLATFMFIKEKDFKDALKISEILLNEKHDLMHKAVGCMLREIGKKDIKVLKDFLLIHYKQMPRTMLRYSIEKFPEIERQKYLNGEV